MTVVGESGVHIQFMRNDKADRRRTYAFDRWAIVRLMVTGYTLDIVDGVPPEARLVGIAWDEVRGQLLVTLQHDSWDVVDQNMMAPIHSVTVRATPGVKWDIFPERGITIRELLDANEAKEKP